MNIINSNLNFRNGLKYGNNPKMLILHHADAVSCTIQDIHQWHLDNGWSGCGYHYFVRKDGTIYIGRDERAVGAHCLNYNAVSIAICSEGNFNCESMGEVQYNSLLQLTSDLLNKHGISKIYAHDELNSTDCPGEKFPLSRIKREAGQSISNNEEYPGYLLVMDSSKNDENVKIIQNKLIGKGYSVGNCGADGYFGCGTLESVKRFQRDSGLSVDGIVGVNTWKRLME